MKLINPKTATTKLKRSKIRALLTVLALISLIIAGCSSSDSSSRPKNDSNSASISTINVPHFSAKDIDGEWRHSSEWLGKQPVVINVWGTWCPPCRREIPDLAKLYEEYKPKGVELISLAVKDTPDRVRQYAERNNMNWVLLMSEDQILIDYKATRGVPTTIFIDRDGNEVVRFIGMKDYDTLKRGFEAIL
ncbi:MAG: TlpA family protein disulfide reductase [candidate division Zixibacteria bacterium]|nr:TlpA family protein disulfide reductase [candidate division Zixibacteria bacterium]